MEHHFKEFKLSGITWTKWGGVAFYVIENKERSRIFRSKSQTGKHAEDFMLDELKELLHENEDSTLKITVYQNASPCSCCSEEYEDLIRYGRERFRVQLKFTIFFVALYKILRPSRKNVRNCPQEVHDENLQGLKQLRKLGVEFHCFDFSAWSKLADYLSVTPWPHSEYRRSTICKDNIATSNDLKLLLGTEENQNDLRPAVGPPNRGVSLASESQADMQTFKAFRRCGLHGTSWWFGVRSLYVLGKEVPSKVFKGNSKKHTEEAMLEELQSRLSPYTGKAVSVIVYQNYSPCWTCSQKYEAFLDKANRSNVDVQLTLVVSGLYKIRRPSCEETGCQHMPSREEHAQALRGLGVLKTKDVTLRSFQYSDWKFLGQHLQQDIWTEEEYRRDARGLEDEANDEDIQLLLESDDLFEDSETDSFAER